MRRSTGTVVLTILLGILIGAILSGVIQLFLKDGSMAEKILVSGTTIGPWKLHRLDLIFLRLNLELEFHFNLMTVVGIFLGLQVLRWYR
jgi:hypothetical protein